MTDQERVAYWQERVSQWHESSLSGAQFCKQQQLIYHQFLYWRCRYDSDSNDAAATDSLSGFAKVVPLADSGNANSLSMTLPNGCAITGITSDNVALISSLLAQL